jgi:hypothetical protein
MFVRRKKKNIMSGYTTQNVCQETKNIIMVSRMHNTNNTSGNVARQRDRKNTPNVPFRRSLAA